MTSPGPDAFFLPDGNAFVATAWTRGPWDVDAQHGGPPSALLARAVEGLLGGEREDWVPARALVTIFRPVPIARLTARAQIDKRGRTALRTSAVLEHDGAELARLGGLLLRRFEGAPTPEPEADEASAAWPAPERCEGFEFPFFLHEVGYHRAMDIRLAGPWPRASARAWSRMRCPLVAGELPSGWQRALCFADAAHGVAPSLDPAETSIINPDLELSLHRAPRGEWIGLDVHTHLAGEGVGTTRSTVVDTAGAVGASSATLVVRRR